MNIFVMAMTQEQMEKKLIGVDEKVSTILDLLQGNKINKNDTGMVGVVDDHEERLTTLERSYDRLKWMIIGMGAPAGIGIIEMLKKIFIK
jgi:hypothetical protein